MTDIAKSQGGSALAGGGSRPVYVARAAVCLVRMPVDTKPMFTTPEARELSTGVSASVLKALEHDPRIASARAARASEIHNASTTTFLAIKDDEDSIVDSIEEYQALRLNEPIIFTVRVPAKNQYKYRGVDDIPSDEYLAVWDGQALIVQWSQETPRRTQSGGHVVIDVLGDAVKTAGYELVVIACAPTCHHRFLHADFVAFETDEPSDHFHADSEPHSSASVIVPWSKPADDLENLRRLHGALAPAMHEHGLAMSTAFAVAYLEHRARVDADVVLKITHDRATRRRFPHITGAVVDGWRMRGTRAFSRELVADLWYALVSLDTRKNDWVAVSSRLRELAEADGFHEVEALTDVRNKAMERIELETLKAAVQEVSARQEGRVLAWATFSGAVAAIGGTVIGSLLR